MMSKSLFIVGIAAVLAIAGCGKSNAPEGAKPSAATEKSAAPSAATTSATTNETSSSAIRVDVKVDPAQPNPNKPANFTAKVTDADGKPVAGADVSVSLVMQSMDMGKNEFKLTDKGAGSYQGEGKFTMAGDWNAVVTATQGSRSAKQTVAVKSVMPKP